MWGRQTILFFDVPFSKRKTKRLILIWNAVIWQLKVINSWNQKKFSWNKFQMNHKHSKWSTSLLQSLCALTHTIIVLLSIIAYSSRSLLFVVHNLTSTPRVQQRHIVSHFLQYANDRFRRQASEGQENFFISFHFFRHSSQVLNASNVYNRQRTKQNSLFIINLIIALWHFILTMGYISNADETPAELFNCHLRSVKFIRNCVRPLQ